MESSSESIYHPVRGAYPSAVTKTPFTQKFGHAHLWSDASFVDGKGGNDVITAGTCNTLIYGGAGNDTITDIGGDDTLYGGTGNDIINDYAGNDTIDGGDGNDVINDYGYGTNVLRGGEGNDSITFCNAGNNIIEGGAGNDTIQTNNRYESSTSATHTLAGGAGNDLLISAASADTYLFNRGDGNDTISDFGYSYRYYWATAGSDTIVFGPGIFADDLSVSRVGDSLLIKIANAETPTAPDSITIENGFADSVYQIEKLQFADGSSLDNSTLSLMCKLAHGTESADLLSASATVNMLFGLDGNDTISTTAGTALLDGGAGNDTLSGGTSAELFLGGSGNDSITTGAGNDLILFNLGDGQDRLTAGGSGANDTLSLGGHFAYADLSLSKTNNDLALSLSATDQITFEDWYSADKPSIPVLSLQVIAEAMADFDAQGNNPLSDHKIETFNFAGLVSAFDTARGADTSLSHWALNNALANFHLSGSDTEALGGDLAYQYGKTASLSGVGLTAGQGLIGDANFGRQAQALQSLSSLQAGAVRLS